jgi:hypothetical protein
MLDEWFAVRQPHSVSLTRTAAWLEARAPLPEPRGAMTFDERLFYPHQDRLHAITPIAREAFLEKCAGFTNAHKHNG